MLTPPFVLLDDARPGGTARLYRDPARALEARTPVDVRAVLEQVRAATADGLHAAGFLTYEAAAGFEPSLPETAVGAPLAWFGLFTTWEDVDALALLPDGAGAHVGAPQPSIDRATYDERFAAVQALTAAGDVAQANLNFPATVAIEGDPLAAYAAIRPRAAAGWGAVVATGRQIILSFSPQLLFSLDGRDLTARLKDGKDAVDFLVAAFPWGFMTGAPKLRAIAALAEIEGTQRGVHTGAIGRIDADGDAKFNVAVRTLTVRDGSATVGLGGGIVADSRVDEEWDEALAKGAFLTAGARPIDLIETMAFDPLRGLALLERHLERMKASAVAFGFAFDRHGARNELQAATFRLREPRRVRLLLAKSGALAIEVGPVSVTPARMEIAIVPLPVAARDFRLRHKTSDRGFYDAARRAAGTAEVVFEDADGFLTEGSFTSLFVEHDGRLRTPPLARGLLPGVLRAELIATGRADEADLTRADLAGGFLLGNALRGLIPAVVARQFVAAAKEPAIAAPPPAKA